MIFERITLHNFQRYHGTSSIDFPETGHSKSIVLILAPNNSGKTTVLRALQFLLYGDYCGYSKETVWNLANSRARKDSEIGENIKVWVEARLSMGNDGPITLRREFQVRQSGPERWITEGPFLLFKKTEEDFQPDDGSLQSKIESAVPGDLFSWFYFAGEPAKGRMSHGNSAALTEPLKKAIQIRRWTDALSTAKGAVASFRKQLQTATANHGAYSDILRRKDVVSKGKTKNEESMTTLHREILDLDKTYDDLDTECRKTSTQAEESQKLYKRLKDQEQKRERAEYSLQQANSEIYSQVSKCAGWPLLESELPNIEARLEELRKANLLPADISKGFIERLLQSPQCVCGREHNDEAVAHLEAYLSRTLTGHTNNDLVNLANTLEGGSDSRVKSAISKYPSSLRSASNRKAEAVRALADARTAIEDLTPQVQASSSVETFHSLVRARIDAGNKIRVKKDSLAELERTIRTQEDSLKRLTADAAKARPKRGIGQIEKSEKALAVAEKLADNLRSGLERFQDSVYDLLQERLSAHFDPAVTGRNRAKIDRKTFLPMIVDPSGDIVMNPGGGEMQVLSIAFVAGLAELRSRINNDLKEAGLAGRLLGEQSFILDSPFTSADHNYMRAIADFLPNKAPQLLVLLAKQNWPDTVREALEPHVATTYGITLHTSAAAHDPTSFDFEINGKTVCLLEKLKDGEETFTSFSKI